MSINIERTDMFRTGSATSVVNTGAKDSVKQNDVQFQYILKKGTTDLESLKTIKAEKGAVTTVTDRDRDIGVEL